MNSKETHSSSDPIIIQAIGIKDLFSRQIGEITIHTIPTPVTNTRRVEVAFGFNMDQGTIYVQASGNLPGDRTQIPHLPYEHAITIYQGETFQPRTPTTVLKEGASLQFTKLPERGDPQHKIPKPAKSFGSPIIGAEIEATTTTHEDDTITVVPECDELADIPF